MINSEYKEERIAITILHEPATKCANCLHKQMVATYAVTEFYTRYYRHLCKQWQFIKSK